MIHNFGRCLIGRYRFAQLHKVTNPLTLEVIHSEPYLSMKEVQPLIESLDQSQQKWKQVSRIGNILVPLAERIALVRQVGTYFEQNIAPIAASVTDTIGKPLHEAHSEIKATIELIDFMCGQATSELQEQVVLRSDILEKIILKEPVGIAFIISSWNYPIFGPATLAIPALLAGNTVLLKPSKHAANLGHTFTDAISQPNLLHSALLNFETCEKVIRSKIGVCQFMGKNSNGKQILAEASHSGLHKVVLELEGKDAAYVDRSCQLEQTSKRLVNGMYANAGQSGHSVERIYVHRDVADQLIQLLIEEIARLQLGDPKLPETHVGPLKLTDVVPIAKHRIDEAVKQGAKVLIGGSDLHLDPWKGTFFTPTLLLGAPQSSEFMQREIFAPMCGVTVVDSPEQAVELINDCQYGLSSSIFAEDRDLFAWMSERLDTGTVFANKCLQVHPGLPWSGRKQSGRSYTLSSRVFEHVTQYKSLHFIY